MNRRQLTFVMLCAVMLLHLMPGLGLGQSLEQAGTVSMAATGATANAKGYYDLRLEPGHQQELTFQVDNPTTEPMTVVVYATDAATADGGNAQARGPEEINQSTGTWISPTTHNLTLGPGERRSVSFVITAPIDAPSGQHVAAVIARVFKPGVDPGAPGQNQANFQINTVHQVLIGVLATIPGEAAHRLTVSGVEHFYQGQQLWMRVKVRNDGTAIETPTGTLQILNNRQQEVGLLKLSMGSLYPGTEGGIVVQVDQGLEQSGQYATVVELSGAGDDAAPPTQAQFPLVLSKTEVKAADEIRYDAIKAQRTDDVLVLPLRTLLLWGGIAVVGLAVTGGTAFVWMRSRRSA